MATSYQ